MSRIHSYLKSIFTLVLTSLFINATAQKKESFLEKTDALLKRDNRVAAYEMNSKRGTAEFIQFDGLNTYPASETNRLMQTWFTSRPGMDVYSISNETSLHDGIKVIRYQQYFKGIKVEFGNIVAITKNEMLGYINAENYIANENKTIVPALNESSALSKAIAGTGAASYAWQADTTKNTITKKEFGNNYPKGELVLMPDMRESHTGMVLAWKFDIYATEPLSRNDVYISAEDGSLIFKNAIIKHNNPLSKIGPAATRYSGIRNITTFYDPFDNSYDLSKIDLGPNFTRTTDIFTYNANHAFDSWNFYFNSSPFIDYDNNWTAAEFDNANKDNAALDAHWGATQVVDYWKTIHNRESYDNNKGSITSYVHFGNNYDNAFWNGFVLIYGDGSGGTNGLSPLTSLDICTHELSHALCSYTANLVYAGEAGAINEGLSDIWSACLEHYTDPADTLYEPFLMGEQIVQGWIKGVNRNAVRDMANPPAKGSPDTYGGINWVTDPRYDNGGVHYNSGVLNKWFYLITHGEAGTNDLGNAYNVAGMGFTKAEQIVYLTELSLTSNANFAQARTASTGAAAVLYGACLQDVITITNAWYAVGVGSATYTPASCNSHIRFLSQGTTVTETVESTDCHPGKTITGTILLAGAVSQTATATLNYFGTAVLNRDYTVSPSSFTFTAGGPTRYNFTITVYDNAIIESDRTLILGYTLTTGLIADSVNQTYTLKITDDDIPPLISAQLTPVDTVLHETFSGNSFPAGWTTGTFTAGPNKWVLGPNATILGSGNAAYITNDSIAKPLTYTKTTSGDVYLLSRPVVATNMTNLELWFTYVCKGEPGYLQQYDYGSLVYSLDGGATIIDLPYTILNNNPTPKAYLKSLPDNIFANKTFRIGFRWTNDTFEGSDPPLAIDNVVVRGSRRRALVETNGTANKGEYVVQSEPVYFLSAQNKSIIALITNASATIGCVNASISESGSGQVNLTSGYTVYKRTSKVFTFEPATANSTVTYRLKLYFTPAELAVWGTKKLNLKFLAVQNGANLGFNLPRSQIKVITPQITDEGDGYISYTGDFTGFSQVMLVDPVTTLSCNAAPYLYVDSSRAESGDGLSWESPFKTLAEALQIANKCPAVQRISVAKGTYYPTYDNNRDSSFRIYRNGIKLEGGYPAGGYGSRDPGANPAILSGNIGTANNSSDNSYHVITIVAAPSSKIDTTVRIDGFTITGGNAGSNLTFNTGGQTIVHDNGGGIYCYGAGSNNSCKPFIVNCTFSSNQASSRGGAVFNEGYNNGNCSPLIVNCVFYANNAGYSTTGSGGSSGGGGAINNNGDGGISSPPIINCSFYGNNANSGTGGAILNFKNTAIAITNSIIYGNTSGASINNIANVSGGSFTNTYSLIQGLSGGEGNVNGNPLFVNPEAGNLQLQQCSRAINSGRAGAIPAGVSTDITGQPRIFNAGADIGAYECRLQPVTFTFELAGNWSAYLNWQCNWVPPSPLPAGSEIIINPIGGDCRLNVPFTVGPGGKLTVKAGKKMVVAGNLQVQ